MLSHMLRTAGSKSPFSLVGYTTISYGVFDINTPSSQLSGDLILLIQSYTDDTTTRIPAGFTLITVESNSYVFGFPPSSWPYRLVFSYKIATSSGPETITTSTIGSNTYCQCVVFRANGDAISTITPASISKYEGTLGSYYTSPLVQTINTSGTNRIIAINYTEEPNKTTFNPSMLPTDTYLKYDFLDSGSKNYTITFNPNSETLLANRMVSFYLEVT